MQVPLDLFDWMYNSRTGAVMNFPKGYGYIELKAGLGWHGPFDSKAKALAYYEANKAGNPGWKAPTDAAGVIANAPDAIVSQAGAAATGALGLSDEELRSWLIRISEIMLGIVLVAVGLAKLTGTTNAIASLVKARIP